MPHCLDRKTRWVRISKAKAANTLRAYQSDWADFHSETGLEENAVSRRSGIFTRYSAFLSGPARLCGIYSAYAAGKALTALYDVLGGNPQVKVWL